MAKSLSTEETVILLERLGRLVRAREHGADLNPAQWEALRYLSRCNGFSNSPAALTNYLGATKGTVSQTLIALERKGLITKAPRPDVARSVALFLTDQGRTKLSEDPWSQVQQVLESLKPKHAQKLSSGIETLVGKLFKVENVPSYGVCTTCRYFREGGAPDSIKGKHWCLQFDALVTKSEAKKICASHDIA
ncbi:MAG: MarR family transcriptional regulator [Anderseniella sp.]